MNERIQELAEQAMSATFNKFSGVEWSAEEWRNFYDTKFAELIVRECLKELRYTVVDTQECRQDKSTDYQVGWEDGMFDAGETIKQHFGVEE
jgi:hypothetical protein